MDSTSQEWVEVIHTITITFFRRRRRRHRRRRRRRFYRNLNSELVHKSFRGTRRLMI